MTDKQHKILSFAKNNNANSIKELEDFPKYMAIATTSLCNARCSMCIIDEWDKSQPFMSDELFNKLVLEIKPNVKRLQRVTIQLNGEPLLDKKLEERIKTLKEVGVKQVFFSTNGSAMTEKRTLSILNSGVDEVDFSIDGITKEPYSQIRHGLDFDTVIKNTKRFFELRNKGNYKTKISIRMTSQPINEHEVEGFYKFWDDFKIPDDRIYAKPIHSWGNELENNTEEREYWKKLNNLPCTALWGTMTILSNGQVVLCCNDVLEKHVLGNVNSKSIKEIWNGKKINNLRKYHIKEGRKKIPMCINCDVWD